MRKGFFVSLGALVMMLGSFFLGMHLSKITSPTVESADTLYPANLLTQESEAAMAAKGLQIKLRNPLMFDYVIDMPQSRVIDIPIIDRMDIEVRNPLMFSTVNELFTEVEAMNHNGGMMGPVTKRFIMEILQKTNTDAMTTTRPATRPSN
jgi:hypothetical protein